MKKRLFAAAAMAAVLSMVLVGCSAQNTSTQQNTEAETKAEVTVEETSAEENTAETEAAAEETTEEETKATAEATTEAESEEASDDLLAKIKEKGTITIAMEGNWAPWTYEDEDGNLVGFEVEVSTAVAEKLGVKPEYVTGEWDGLLAGVQSGRYDLMANGVGYTQERAQAYYFSDFYAYNRTALVVRGDNKDITSMKDLKGKTTGNSANSTYQLTAESYGATVKDIESLNGTISELLAGRIDATLNAEVSINDYMKEQPDADIKIVAYADDVEKVGMIMPYGEKSASLQAAVNEALAELLKDGVLAEISEKYFGMDITKAE